MSARRGGSAPRPVVPLTADDGELLARAAQRALAMGRRVSDGTHRRAVHSFGDFATGMFTAHPGADARTVAAHLQPGVVTPVLVRFSNSSPRPPRDDRRRGARGMAVRFLVAGGPPTDAVAMNSDRFFVDDRPTFLAFCRVAGKRWWWQRVPAGVWLVATRRTRPDLALRALTAFPPGSYARCQYHGINTFLWRAPPAMEQVAMGQVATPVRFRWEPEAGRGRAFLPRRRLRDPDFLRDDLRERLAGTDVVRFQLEVQYGDGIAPERLTDATRPWDRDWIGVGTLELDTLVDDPDEIERYDARLFSPLHLCPGIEPHPADEILALRGAAYVASHAARTAAATDATPPLVGLRSGPGGDG